MSAYYYGPQHAHPAPAVSAAAAAASSSHSHHGRSRRAPRLSVSQNAGRQFRSARGPAAKEVPDATALLAFRSRFEATRSFDLEDDLEFCPNLLTDIDVSLFPISSSFPRTPSPVHPLDREGGLGQVGVF